MKMTKKWFRENRKGLTLVELVITLAIAILILGAIFSFFFFNNSLYNKGTALSQVQFDVRMASQYVTKELRNVDEISTTDNALADSMDLTSLSAKYPLVNGISFEIVNSGTHYMVSYTIQGSDASGENNYQIDTNVLLNNITNTTPGSGSVIYYE
ncbi:prepilin-type N-terminal cleavage/methylation domain-containing protein [Alkalibacter rhizosphaerae]|uniref:Prepilin-type N-terminal cleavage/methylation domain-containing protein n=1 Tax=Alkalibacter rhizosphaerae TaxID=2815577 RepID=A0A974XF80_9FIRM|nr:prepilin-type N-terminal cleavage/methylation domain-containing protein [Alkalibacter rhizosphaerae]QSX08651.1 prepilin-type N-terminal cleavage/methylation domain-containing protein [Alkalibacter rhizosphaerae]